MKKVYQTKYGEGKGNCFQAAVASILELNLSDVPDFVNEYKIRESQWWEEYNKWLSKYELSAICITYGDWITELYRDTFLLVTGPSKANGVMHSVVYCGGALCHDPHKGWNGVKPKYVDLLIPRDPAKCK
jgi:hypothetical protein